MTICRWGPDSDIYAFKDAQTGGYCCMQCLLKGATPSSDSLQGFDTETTDFRADTPEEFLQHLLEHKKAGHKVPDHAIEYLQKEITDG